MQTRDDKKLLFTLRQNPSSFFSLLPRELVVIVNGLFAAEVKTLLHHEAYGDPERVKEILDKDPKLLLLATDAEDPAGNQIFRVTAYQCALGAKDPEMAALILLLIFQSCHKVKQCEQSKLSLIKLVLRTC